MLNIFLKKSKDLLDIKISKQTYLEYNGIEYNLIVCGYFCIGFIDYMFAGTSLIDYTSCFFSPYDFNKNDDIILTYFT